MRGARRARGGERAEWSHGVDVDCLDNEGAAVGEEGYRQRGVYLHRHSFTLASSPDLARAGIRSTTRRLPVHSSPLHAGTSIACAPRCCPSRWRSVPCVKQRLMVQAASTCQTHGENSAQRRSRYRRSESTPTPSLPPSVRRRQ